MKEHNKTTLKEKLSELKDNFNKSADTNKKQIYENGIAAVEESGIVASALQVGDIAPNFTLTNAVGTEISLYDFLKKGKVILTWYRGNWCPYCNLTLRELQQHLLNFESLGAKLIALTPELPDESLNTKDKHDLNFEVLSDVGNKVAKDYGVVFKLEDDVAEIYNKSFGLNRHNGDNSNELPLAATYIINSDKEIIYSFLDSDYRNRAEPEELIEVLKK